MARLSKQRVSSRNSIGDKRAMILRAATHVFARNGYFKSKEEILHSIFDQNMAEAIASGRRLIANVKDPREKLRRIAKLHLERLGADRDLAVVFQVELRGSTKFMQEFSAAGFAEYLDLLRNTFEEGQRSGAFRKNLNAKLMSKILFGALDEMATNWIISKRNYKLEPMADVVMDVFLNGVSAS